MDLASVLLCRWSPNARADHSFCIRCATPGFSEASYYYKRVAPGTLNATIESSRSVVLIETFAGLDAE